jgi:polysaccharide biosynthesis transport protein
MSMASLSPRPAGGNQFGDAESDLPALGAALWRNKWQIVRPTVIAVAVVEMIPPRYLSEARVLIEGRDNVFLRPNADKDLVDRNTVDQEAVTSQVQLILSRDLASEVIDKLKLGERPEFDPALGGISPLKKVLGTIGVIKNPMRMTPEERVLDAYYDRLQVFAVEKSRVIVIDFLSEDPKLAAESPTPLPKPIWCASRRRSSSRHAPRANGSPARSKACVRRWPMPKRRLRRSGPTPIFWSVPTTRRSRRSRSAT